MSVPYINYESPGSGGQKVVTLSDITIYLLHGSDTSGNQHFNIVDAATNDILRVATKEEVRGAGINVDLFPNAFPEEPPVEEPPVEEPPVEEPPVEEGTDAPAV